jgi:cytidyltransferase-like protein
MADSFGHGLVPGKFYPPHLGHLHLISEAAAGCDAVTVLVMAARSETLPLADRVGWLRAACSALPGVAVSGVVCDAAAGRAGPALDELTWAAPDFDAIAAEQTRRENEAAAAGSPLVVCDTDAFVTSVWERRYLGGRARGRQPWAAAALPPRDVYLLTSHEGVPWHDDGLREGDLAVRAAMTGWFMTALTAAGHSWVLLTGSLDERLALATRVTDYVLGNRSRFGAAITEGVEIR